MVARSGVGWNLSPCLGLLVDETDRLFPSRSTASDGSIGDPSHQARPSDHNPKEPRPPGWVDAVDLTDDDEAGADVSRLVHHLVASKDQRVKYLILNSTVWRSYAKPGLPAWTPAPYTGPNPHTKHVHISIVETQRHSTASWWAAAPDPEPPTPEEQDVDMLIIKCTGKPTRFLDGPLCPVISLTTAQSLALCGVKTSFWTTEDYDRLLDHVERSFGEK